MAQQRFPVGTILAFLAGATAGIAAGMLTEKKNREKAANFAGELKDKALERVKSINQKPADKVQVVASDIRSEAEKNKAKAGEKLEELKDEVN